METQGLQDSGNGQESTETLKVLHSGNCSRKDNDEARGRSNLFKHEIEAVCKSIQKGSRHAIRDELAVLMTYHHGLRASECVDLKWQHIDLKTRQVHIKRKKDGVDSVHPITSKREVQLLNKLYKEQGKPTSGFVFNTERKTPMSVNGLQKMFAAFSEKALKVKWNIHALRHSCGTDLVSKGHHLRTIQYWLGHKNIQNTTIYLAMSPDRFANIEWD